MDTPRTNEVGARWAKVSKSEMSMELMELYALARTLERELASKEARIEELERCLGEAHRALAAKEAQLREAERDARRLDWLEKHPFTLYRTYDVNHFVMVDERVRRHEDRRGLIGKTVREAIDLASES